MENKHQVIQQTISRPSLWPKGHWSLLGNQSVRERSLRLIRSSGHLSVPPCGGANFSGAHCVWRPLCPNLWGAACIGQPMKALATPNIIDFWDTLASPIFNHLPCPVGGTPVRFANSHSMWLLSQSGNQTGGTLWPCICQLLVLSIFRREGHSVC